MYEYFIILHNLDYIQTHFAYGQWYTYMNTYKNTSIIILMFV